MAVDPVSLAITAALTVAQMALTASQKFEGPRLDSTDVSGGEYGTPWPKVWGIRRLEGVPIGWAEKLREKKVTTKTKGGKYAEWKYWGTWKVFLTDHPIEAVSRIWLDKHLVYQTRTAGPIAPVLGLIEGPFGLDLKLSMTQNLRIYLGTEDQMPDPRYEAWCEDRYGPNSAPALRGRSYMVFEEIPLEKFGNRIPQITVEVVSNKGDAFPYEVFTTSAMTGSRFAFGGEWLAYNTNYGHIEWWDVGNRTRMGFSPNPGLAASSVPNVAFGNDGQAVFVGAVLAVGSPVYLCTAFPLEGVSMFLTNAASPLLQRTRVIGPGIYTAYQNTAGWLSGVLHQDHAMCARDFCPDSDGETWVLLQPLGASDDFVLECLTELGTPSISFTGAVVRSNVTAARLGFSPDGRFYVHGGDGYAYIVDRDTGALLDTIPQSAGGDPDFRQQGESTFWDLNSEYSLSDGSLVRTVDYSDFTIISAGDPTFDPVNNAIWLRQAATNSIYVLYLDRVGNAGVELRQIVEDVAGWCGVSNVIANDLTPIVKGYSVTQGTGQAMIEPLLALHDCNARPHGFALEFLKHTGIAVGGLATEDLVRDGDEPRYSWREAPDPDLPELVTVNFADDGKDQQTNNVVARRPGGTNDSSRNLTIDITTYVGVPDEIQKLADRYLRRLWAERETIELTASRQQLELEPGDVKTPELDGIERGARCRKLTIGRHGLRAELVRDAPSLAGLSTGTGAPMDGRDPEAIYVPGPTRIVVIDGPLISDAHELSNVPQLYYGAGKYISTATWPGAEIWRADASGDEYAPWRVVEAANGMTWGITNDALGGVYSPWYWDRGNSLNVNVRNGSLSNATEDDIDADPSVNLAALWNPTTGAVEYLNFTTATLEVDGTTTLSGFKRGRRGTEGACGDHSASEILVLLSGLARDGLALSEVGTAEGYRGVSYGRDPATGQLVEFSLTGATLKPYAPVHLEARLDGATGDWAFTWHRRTRIGGAWVGGTTIPLGEVSEAYELVIPTSGGGSRTITASSASATWSAAEQVADYGAPQTSLPAGIVVYQLSDAVGRGFESEPALAA
jgi:hypothetical protein